MTMVKFMTNHTHVENTWTNIISI